MYACPSNRRARNFHRQSSPSSRAPSRAVVVIDRSIVRSFDPKSPRRAPSLSRVFRAHRFVRAPERGATRVNTASRDDARGLTSDNGGCGEHVRLSRSARLRLRLELVRRRRALPLRPPSTRLKTRVDGRSTVDGRRRRRGSLARDDRRRRASILIHSFIHSFVSRRFRRRRRSAAVVVSCRETPARDSSRSASRSSPSSRSVRSGSVDSWRDGWRCETR